MIIQEEEKRIELINVQQQAFEGLRTASRDVRRPDCTLATVDHVSIHLQSITHFLC